MFDAYIDHATLESERGFRGCGLLNAAAELATGTPARDAVRNHKEHVQRLLTDELRRITSALTAKTTAEHCSLLLEGAMSLAGLDGTTEHLQHAKALATRLLTAL